MLKRTSTPAKKNLCVFDLIKNHSIASSLKRKSIGIQTDTMEQCTNTANYVDEMLIQGRNMNDNDFEKFIKVHGSDCYWQILAERARLKLEDQLRDNQQLHELIEELIKENEQLHMKNEQCEYLTNVFNSMISEYDSGIELHITDESPASKRQKIHT